MNNFDLSFLSTPAAQAVAGAAAAFGAMRLYESYMYSHVDVHKGTPIQDHSPLEFDHLGRDVSSLQSVSEYVSEARSAFMSGVSRPLEKRKQQVSCCALASACLLEDIG